jgi:transcriptional regulator with XRE-family HTH domain
MENGPEEKFGDHLRSLRQGRGLTQAALAEKSDLSVDAVRRVERGIFSPSLQTVGKLAKGLNVSLKTLFLTFGRKRYSRLEELCDFLAGRTRSEIAQAWRVLRAMFGPNSNQTRQA